MLFCPNTASSHGGGLESKALCPTTCDRQEQTAGSAFKGDTTEFGETPVTELPKGLSWQ